MRRVVLRSIDMRTTIMQTEMWKIKQLDDFENQNHYKTVILKIEIEIITNYVFLKSKSSLNLVILKIILKFNFEL